MGLRPIQFTKSTVGGGETTHTTFRGTFHGFFSEGNEDGVDTFAIVELEDGTVKKIFNIDSLKFMDRETV